jgi:large subunit ribosomal protein L3
MGCVRRTVQNLQVIEVRADDHILLIRGAIPGANGDYVIVRGSKKLPKGSPRAAARLAAYEGKSTDAASIKAQKK